MTGLTMQKISMLAAVVLVAGCAYQRLHASELDQVSRPAFISRIEEGAGPKSLVFRDSSYRDRLNGLDPVEADRRLRAKLAKGISRFEVSDRIRAVVLSQLPKERPWTRAIDPVAVAGVLESFLVEEVPANPPDYNLLKPLGADAVVEFVIEGYGMRSVNGRAGAFVTGHGRMFFLGGPEIWRSPFGLDQIELGHPPLDPFAVAKRPELFREAISGLLDQVAGQMAKELSPPERRVEPPHPSTGPEGLDDNSQKPKSEEPELEKKPNDPL